MIRLFFHASPQWIFVLLLSIKKYKMKNKLIIYLLLIFGGSYGMASGQMAFNESQNEGVRKFKVTDAPLRRIKLSTGVELEYAEQGELTGTPVILLHGYTDSWRSFESVLPYLPHNLRVFAITQRGHGNSSKPDSGYHPTDFAADIAAFIKMMDLGSVIIVGHSMGGVIAQQFALDYPHLMKGLVILDSAASFKDNPGLQEFLKEVSGLMDPVSYQFANEFQNSTLAKAIDPSYYAVLTLESVRVPARVWKAALSSLMSVDLSARLNQIDKPALVFWGDKDAICPGTDQKVLVNGIKHARLIVYEGTGHALHWEEPERFAKDLTEFINTIWMANLKIRM